MGEGGRPPAMKAEAVLRCVTSVLSLWSLLWSLPSLRYSECSVLSPRSNQWLDTKRLSLPRTLSSTISTSLYFSNSHNRYQALFLSHISSHSLLLTLWSILTSNPTSLDSTSFLTSYWMFLLMIFIRFGDTYSESPKRLMVVEELRAGVRAVSTDLQAFNSTGTYSTVQYSI